MVIYTELNLYALLHTYVFFQWRIQGVSLVSTETPFQVALIKLFTIMHNQLQTYCYR